MWWFVVVIGDYSRERFDDSHLYVYSLIAMEYVTLWLKGHNFPGKHCGESCDIIKRNNKRTSTLSGLNE